MQGDVQTARVALEDGLRPVAVVHIEVDDRDLGHAAHLGRVQRAEQLARGRAAEVRLRAGGRRAWHEASAARREGGAG